MRGAMLYGSRDIRFVEREDPTIIEPTDVIIRMSATCVCGSDLWDYRGINKVTEPKPWVTSTAASWKRSAARSPRSGPATPPTTPVPIAVRAISPHASPRVLRHGAGRHPAGTPRGWNSGSYSRYAAE